MMRFLLVLAAANLAFAQPGVVSIISYDESGSRLATGPGFVLGPGGDLVVRRSQLSRASTAEVRTQDGAIWPIGSIGGEDLDADLLRVRANAPYGPLQSLAIADQPARLKPHDVPGFGLILELREPAEPGTVITNQRGEAEAIALGGRFAAPMDRVQSLDRAGARTLAEWRAGFSPERIASESPYRDALAHLREERYSSALPDLEFAVKKDPSFAEAWFQLGIAAGRMGRSEQKIDAYEKAIALKPDLAEARYNLALSLLLAGYREAAEAQVVMIKPWNAELAEKLRDIIYLIRVDPVERTRLVQ